MLTEQRSAQRLFNNKVNNNGEEKGPGILHLPTLERSCRSRAQWRETDPGKPENPDRDQERATRRSINAP